MDHPLRSDNAAQARLHRGHQQQRRAILGKLLTAEQYVDGPADLDVPHPARKLINKLTACGAHAAVHWSEHQGRLVASHARCKARLCPKCGEIRAHQLRDGLRPILSRMDSPRLLTLTLKASGADLKSQVKRLTQCFRKLRQTHAGKMHLIGGVYVVEITYNARLDAWHPHLHVVADGSYWPQGDLADLWETITGDSRIVDIRAVHGKEQVLRYVSKYVTKCQQPRDVPPDRLLEWCQAVHGLPMARPWGNCHGSKVAAQPKPETGPLAPICPVQVLLDAARAGDETASGLLQELGPATRVRPADGAGRLPPELRAQQEDLRDRLAAWWAAEQRRRENATSSQTDNLQCKARSQCKTRGPTTYNASSKIPLLPGIETHHTGHALDVYG